ncbi:uncharacterized protein AKAME5_001896200 [Lates japonicus]|uniref:Shelterin complex subunit TPP1/Est3 domain-containing protein n=1 Tax=Lates japonicus TaxID=270547 RepID=A0AAD3NA72_LATJO|nr:uncharacterized protein AKAME5_001896200 [Lates japonicus]
MPRPARSRLCPWIETLILSYGSEEGGSSSTSSGRLKAHVIGVGQMSQSQAQGSEGPSGLLFLSDGVLQIPALLTASAWEHLQEQEDRECFTSLVNTTVCIQDYRLHFHMAPEQNKCRRNRTLRGASVGLIYQSCWGSGSMTVCRLCWRMFGRA